MSLPEYPWEIGNAKSRPCPECGSTKTHWHGKLYCQGCDREFTMTRQEAYGSAMCHKCYHAAHPDSPCLRCVKTLEYWQAKAKTDPDSYGTWVKWAEGKKECL